MERSPTNNFFLSFFFFFVFFFLLGHHVNLVTAQNESVVKVGVISDFESLRGKKDWASISMAIDDFYSTHGNITSRVILLPRDSQKDIVGAASAGERLESNLSRFAVIIWVFVVLILTSSYTASLTSMLTVKQLQPSVTDLNQLLKNGDYIGYQKGSFVVGILKEKLKFDANKLRNYSTTAQYADALKRGSKNGGVAAIFDEIPYLKLFLSEHCDDYAMVGRTYKTDGFGFVFPKGSPLVPDVSRGILNVTEGSTMANIERKWFGDQTTCPNGATGFTSDRLNFRSFGGLFLITGCVSLLALILFFFAFIYKERVELKKAASQSTLWRKMVEWAQCYDRKDVSSHTFKDYAASENEGGSKNGKLVRDDVVTPNIVDEGSQSPVSVISNFSDLNFSSSNDGSVSFREQSEAAESAVEMAEIRVGN